MHRDAVFVEDPSRSLSFSRNIWTECVALAGSCGNKENPHQWTPTVLPPSSLCAIA